MFHLFFLLLQEEGKAVGGAHFTLVPHRGRRRKRICNRKTMMGQGIITKQKRRRRRRAHLSAQLIERFDEDACTPPKRAGRAYLLLQKQEG